MLLCDSDSESCPPLPPAAETILVSLCPIRMLPSLLEGGLPAFWSLAFDLRADVLTLFSSHFESLKRREIKAVEMEKWEEIQEIWRIQNWHDVMII